MDSPRLQLHIPAPAARPGDAANFDHLRIPAPAEGRCPEIEAPEAQLRDLPYGLIRVLDDHHRAAGPWNPSLATGHLLRGLRTMLLNRIFDERMVRAHRQGKTTFYVKSTGEEAIGAAQSLALGAGDMCFP